MNSSPNSPQPVGNPWQVSSVRITAFSSEPPDIRTVDWWELVTGSRSESKNIQAGLGQLMEQGTLGDQVLRLQIQIGRIDWILVPKDELQLQEFPLLGDFNKVSSQFRDLISRWLNHPPRLNRLAFGAVLYVPEPSLADAATTISKVIPYVNIQWSGIRDFVFQFNRPRPCVSYPDVGEIFRLNKWQTVALRKMITVFSTDASGGPVATSEQIAASWEVDVNTSPFADGRKEIPGDLALSVVDELIQNAAAMLKGDAQ